MENSQKNSTNTGIVVGVLCLVIGVVLGAVVTNMKTPAGSQEGATVKSTTSTPVQPKIDPELQKAVASGKAMYLDMKKPIRDAFVAAGGSPSSILYVYQCASIGFFTMPVPLSSASAGTCDFLGTIDP